MSSPAFDITSPLSDLVEATLKEGPQVVTKDGVETAVLISIEDWKRLKTGNQQKLPSASSRSLKDVLLDPDGPILDDDFLALCGERNRRLVERIRLEESDQI